MPVPGRTVPLLVTVALLVTLLYPALFLGYRVAPEASLKSEAPWRAQLGRYPNPSHAALVAATNLGPRLAGIARSGLGVALWNPWIGGGRPGWLSGAREGGAPLPLVAGLLARPGWSWTALAALEVALAFAAAWCVMRGLGLDAWPAAIGATAYALSGAAVAHWLDWRGSALALGPFALWPAVSPPRRPAHRVAAWAGVLVVLLACGAPAGPFVALAAALALLSRPIFARPTRWGAPLVALAIATATVAPSLWLQRSGTEPAAEAAAPVAARQPGPVAPDPARVEHAAEQDPAAGAASLAAAALLLAVVGVFRLPARPLGFWLGALVACGALALGPARLLSAFALSQRPLGAAALVVAVLAGHGGQLLCHKVAAGRWRNAAGFAVWLVLAVALLPPAARAVPFATPEDADLPSPIPTGEWTGRARIVAVLGMLPPDVGATLGLPDVRAASLGDEPRYAALLGPGRDGQLTVPRTLDERVARLGACLVLEPLPLHVVSGELFARVDVADLGGPWQRSVDGLERARVDVPAGACRLGVAARTGPGDVWLERAGHRSQLEVDLALAPESDAWRWFSLPAGWPAGAATLALSGGANAAGSPTLAWDTSGMRLVSEDQGTRLWQWDRGRPVAYLAAALAPEGTTGASDPRAVTVPANRLTTLAALAAGGAGRVRVARVTPTRIELAVDAPRPALLVVQVKYRPALWVADVAGETVATERVDGVWTGVAVPAGASRVVVRARVPMLAWLVACAGLVALAAAALAGGRR